MSTLFADNPLRSRIDLQAAVRTLFAPVKGCFSTGAARVKLGYTGAHYPEHAAELEGFARPLWGLVPLAAGGGDFSNWELYHQGLANGSDPQHPEYWGAVGDYDHALIEMAAIGFALALAPQHVWEPLDSRAQANLGRWLLQINKVKLYDNNWLFFSVLVNLGLAQVGAEHDVATMRAALDRLDAFYLGDGWYSDGPTMQRDYYVAFAMHFYGLIYAKLAAESDPERARRLCQRAAAFAPDFMHWFAADGAALPFGRSLTYRFAQGVFWGALAFADVEGLPWGVVKGLALRHLRWWAQRPITYNDGSLSIGYAYPNLNMAEAYNAPGSTYWALKFFLPLALPETHPFWQADEVPFPALPPTHVQPHAGMIVCRDAISSHVFTLSSGQYRRNTRHGAEKYAKFAYSTAFGFSVPSSQGGLGQGAHDSMLALTDDGKQYRVREELLEATLEGDVLYSRWQPWPDVEVETWLLPYPPWHVRVHRLRIGRSLRSAEGGFALARPSVSLPNEHSMLQKDSGYALATYPTGWSGIRDLRSEREGQVVLTDPNTNLLHPRTVLPTLVGKHKAGKHWLVCAVLGLPGEGAWHDIWNKSPSIPDIPIKLQGQRTVIYKSAQLQQGWRARSSSFVRYLKHI